MSKVRKDNVSKKMTVLTNYVMKMMVDLGKRAEGDIPRVQQGRRGLHLCWGAQVCHDPPAGQGWEDDGDGALCLCWGAQARHDKKNDIQVTYKEIDEMIHTVDKNGDGKINYSEFRVMMGAHPLIIPAPALSKSGLPTSLSTPLTIIKWNVFLHFSSNKLSNCSMLRSAWMSILFRIFWRDDNGSGCSFWSCA